MDMVRLMWKRAWEGPVWVQHLRLVSIGEVRAEDLSEGRESKEGAARHQDWSRDGG